MKTNLEAAHVISAFAKAVRECNSVPVLPDESIIEIRRYVGKDGNERELVIVEELESAPPKPGCQNTTRTYRLYGKQPMRGIICSLRNGYGMGDGVVTDGKSMRYVG